MASVKKDDKYVFMEYNGDWPACAKVYVAGKVSGLPFGDVFTKFGMAEYWLKSQGYEVVNPLRLCSTSWSWSKCMRVCLAELIKCDAICMLPDWTDSRGAHLEWAVATHLLNAGDELQTENR